MVYAAVHDVFISGKHVDHPSLLGIADDKNSFVLMLLHPFISPRVSFGLG